MDLSEPVPRLSVVADNETVLDGLSAGARRRGRELPVLVECDTGFGRNGVQTPAAALELARSADRLPGLRFAGLMVFPNTAPGTLAFFTEARRASSPPRACRSRCAPAAAARRSLTLADYPMMTEHRAGTYVYGDVMMMQLGRRDASTTARSPSAPPWSAARPRTAPSSTPARRS